MSKFLAVVWDFNPTFFWIGSLDIRYYGVIWASAILLGGLFFIQFVRREGLPDKVADSIFIYGALATIIGARLGHCLFYEPAYYLANPIKFLAFRDGGLASHGAAFGLLLGIWLFARKNKLPYLWALDRIMIPVAIGGAMIRFGNLLNSEIYGVETSLPWGFIFVRNGETLPKHPTQLYEGLCYLLLFAILCILYYKKDLARKNPGLIFGVGLVGVFLSRFFIEYVKNPQVEFETFMRLHMGQWLSVPFIILGIVMIIYGIKHKVADLPPLADKSFWPRSPEAKEKQKKKEKAQKAAQDGGKSDTAQSKKKNKTPKFKK